MTIAILAPLAAAAQELYTVYNGRETLTFYYDKKRSMYSQTTYSLQMDSWISPHARMNPSGG